LYLFERCSKGRKLISNYPFFFEKISALFFIKSLIISIKAVSLEEKVQRKMGVERKSRAFNPSYESPDQLSIEGFETPFARRLRSDNRWVVLAGLILWDEIVSVYRRKVTRRHSGRKPLNPRIVTGSLIIKHMLNIDDRETVAQIAENVYLLMCINNKLINSDIKNAFLWRNRIIPIFFQDCPVSLS
jgi:hypothetical protein